MLVNERQYNWTAELTLSVLRSKVKPDADLVIVNGFPVPATEWPRRRLAATDRVCLIRRGEIPPPAELRALAAARHTPGVAERLATARVGVAGCGGLGSQVALALARIGVGRLLLVDFDVVEPSNLNRQAYRIEQLGRPKVEALAENLAAGWPGGQVETLAEPLTPANAAGIFAGCAVVAECLDQPEAKQMLVETLLAERPELAVVAASGLAGLGDPNLIRTRRAGRRLYLVGDETSAAGEGMGLMAPRVLVAAGHQATAVVRLLLGEEPCPS